MKKLLKNKWFYFVIIFIFMLIFNFLTPYIWDDYQYSYLSDASRRVSSLIDVFSELKHMYFSWGGRVFAHFFAYTLLMFPKWIFNIINSLVYVGNIYLIYLIVMNNKKDNYFYLLLIHMFIFIFFPVFGQVFLWLDGSCNYSFTLFFQLLFIYKILNIKKDNISTIILYMILGLFAGMCNENSSLSLIVFLIIYMIINRKYMKVKVLSLITLVSGFLFMILAPGNYKRLLTTGVDALFVNTARRIFLLFKNFWPIIIAVLLLFYVIYKFNKKDFKRCIFYLIPCSISFFSIIAIPQFSIRVLTITFIYLLIITMIMINCIKKKYYKKCICVITSIVFIVILVITARDYYDYYSFMKNRINTINTARENGEKYVMLDVYPMSKNCRIPISCAFPDIRKKEYPLEQMSKYYGIEIRVKK